MQDTRRPAVGLRRGSAARDRTQVAVPWSRRMEEAREARANALAARSVEQGSKGRAAASAVPVSVPDVQDADEAARAGRARRLPMWAVGGFLAAAVAGGIAVVFSLSGAGDPPAGPEPELAEALAPSPVEATASPPGEVTGDADRVEEAGLVDGPRPTEDAGFVEPVGGAEPSEPGAVQPARGASPSDLTRDAGRDAVAAGLRPPGMRIAEPEPASDASGVSVADAAPTVEPDAPSAGLPPASTNDLAAAGAGPEEPAAEGLAGLPDAVVPDVATSGAGASTGPSNSAGTAGAAGSRPDGASPAALAPQTALAAEGGAGADAGIEAIADGPSTRDGVVTTDDPVAEAIAAAAAAMGGAGTAAAAERGFLVVNAAPGVSPQRLDEVLDALGAAGYAVDRSVRVSFRISQTNVRYFHAEDAEIAAGVAEAISGTARDFTDYRPSPDPGVIEVWLEG